MNLLLLLHAFVTLALIGVILIQRSEGGGLGLGSSPSSGLFTARGSANLLTRVTAVLAALFIGNCLLMTIVTSHQLHSTDSIIGSPVAPSQNP